MGRSVTVLGWTDIQSLVRICTFSFPSDGTDSSLEAIRRDVLDSFVPFFQRWQPDQMMDDELRRPLVESLEILAGALAPQKMTRWFASKADGQDLPFSEMGSECSRIAKLVRSAMSRDNNDDEPGTPGRGALTALVIFLASQGEMLAGSLGLAASPLSR